MRSLISLGITIALASTFGVGLASIGHAGILDDVRGAIDLVREGTDTVNDAKDATNDVGDLLPDVAEDKPAPTKKAEPPRLPTAEEWHVSIDGESAGPFNATKIKGLIAKGQVNRESLVWKEGMANWVPASSVKELSRLFSATPPPLPPR